MMEHDMRVVNSHGNVLIFADTTFYMDENLREELTLDMAVCDYQEQFDLYAKAHLERFGETWICDEKDPLI